MESELMKTLNELSNDLHGELEALNAEYSELSGISHNQTFKDKKRIKEIRKEVIAINEKLKEIDEDLKYAKELDTKIIELSSLISKSKDPASKHIVSEELEAYKEQEEEFYKRMNIKYKDLMEVDEEDKLEETEGKKKTFTKKKAISIVAILLALGLGIGFLKGCSNSKKTNVTPNEPTISDSPNINPSSTPGIILEKAGFTSINDKEQLELRASELVEYFDKISPKQEVELEDVIEFLNYINGGAVTEASREGALNVISQIEVLMNNESAYAVDMINKEESGRENQNVVIDYGKFFLDGSNGQKLASQISSLRSGMILHPTADGSRTYATDFTKLLMGSWYLNGYESISAYALETAGMEALIDKLFLNTGALAGAVPNVVVTNPLTSEKVTLVSMIKEINKAACPMEITADNGETFTKNVDKFSYDMEGMLKEAIYNTELNKENFGRTLIQK